MIKNPSQIPGNGKYTLFGQKKMVWSKKNLGLEKIRAKRGFFLTTQGRKIDAHFQIKFARNTVYHFTQSARGDLQSATIFF